MNNLFRYVSVVAAAETYKAESAQVVEPAKAKTCNHADNYYGDQVCQQKRQH